MKKGTMDAISDFSAVLSLGLSVAAVIAGKMEFATYLAVLACFFRLNKV